MTGKIGTFAGQLLHFAESVDIVDDYTLDAVRSLVYSYVRDELSAQYFELVYAEQFEEGPALRTFWSSRDLQHFWPVHNPEGSFTDPVAQVFGTGRALWLLAPDRSPLGAESTYEDRWSDLRNIPPYKPSAELPVHTVIVIPLSYRGRSLGTYLIESARYVESTDVAKVELSRLGSALSILYDLYNSNRAQAKNTANAIGDLRELLAASEFPRLAKPHFFLAYPDEADHRVKYVIDDVLEELSDKLEFTDWAAIYKTGNVPSQIATEISRSRFGICYFSQKRVGTDEGMPLFEDNPNVLFEAGMLHARTSITGGVRGEPSGWIPIREVSSPPKPFDFQSERIIEVPRTRSGELKEEVLRDTLKRWIENLIGR
ncbi:MAG: hypothetical protein ACRDT0_27585 [Pseudonocardiaceae bacterium]